MLVDPDGAQAGSGDAAGQLHPAARAPDPVDVRRAGEHHGAGRLGVRGLGDDRGERARAEDDDALGEAAVAGPVAPAARDGQPDLDRLAGPLAGSGSQATDDEVDAASRHVRLLHGYVEQHAHVVDRDDRDPCDVARRRQLLGDRSVVAEEHVDHRRVLGQPLRVERDLLQRRHRLRREEQSGTLDGARGDGQHLEAAEVHVEERALVPQHGPARRVGVPRDEPVDVETGTDGRPGEQGAGAQPDDLHPLRARLAGQRDGAAHALEPPGHGVGDGRVAPRLTGADVVDAQARETGLSEATAEHPERAVRLDELEPERRAQHGHRARRRGGKSVDPRVLGLAVDAEPAGAPGHDRTSSRSSTAGPPAGGGRCAGTVHHPGPLGSAESVERPFRTSRDRWLGWGR